MSECIGAGCTHRDHGHKGVKGSHVRVEMPTIHPANTPEGQALSNKERIERETQFRQVISHLSLRKQRKMLARAGLDAPAPAEHQPQQALSRRTRRQMARVQAKPVHTPEKATQHVMKTPAVDSLLAAIGHVGVKTGIPLDSMTLKELRTVAQEKGVRVDGKRPSLCSKAELLEALT